MVLPTDQLTNLYKTQTRRRLHGFLAALPAHRSLCIRMSNAAVHVCATQLQSLVLLFCESNTTSEAFDCLTIPAIRHLCSSIYLDESPRMSFTSLISRSSCSLYMHSLHSFQITSTDLIECLRAVSSLCESSITDINIGNEVFRMFDPSYRPDPDASGSVLPNLNTFTYTGRLDLDFVILANLLRSRWEREGSLNVSWLESVKF